MVLDNVSKVFEATGGKAVNALTRLSLTIEPGEFLAIVGPSGSGKTTVLRLIAGLETPNSGTISIAERVVNDVPAAKRDAAMVFQNPALYPHLSVAENLGFGLSIRQWARSDADRRVREVAELVQLTPWLDSMPAELSGGQRQRVAIGRALARRASLLLLDEPLANIDPALRGQMRAEVASLKKRLGTTTIYVTHDHLEAMLLGDRVAVLHQGMLQQIADPLTLYSRPKNLFVAGFFGTCPMNLFPGALKTDGRGCVLFEPHAQAIGSSVLASAVRFRFKSAGSLESWLNKPVLLGARAENIGLAPCDDPDSAQFRARISLIENAGADLYVQATWHGQPFVSRLAPPATLVAGDECAFHFDASKCSWFDPRSGEAIEDLCAC